MDYTILPVLQGPTQSADVGARFHGNARVFGKCFRRCASRLKNLSRFRFLLVIFHQSLLALFKRGGPPVRFCTLAFLTPSDGFPLPSASFFLSVFRFVTAAPFFAS